MVRTPSPTFTSKSDFSIPGAATSITKLSSVSRILVAGTRNRAGKSSQKEVNSGLKKFSTQLLNLGLIDPFEILANALIVLSFYGEQSIFLCLFFYHIDMQIPFLVEKMTY